MTSSQLKTRDDIGTSRKAEFRRSQQVYQRSRRVEFDYARKLRSIAAQVGGIIREMAPEGKVKDVEGLKKMLGDYSKLIEPWARSVAKRMLAEVSLKDEDMWASVGKEIGRNLKREVEYTNVGYELATALNNQVGLITSLPLEAAQRVHDLTMLGLSDSTRSSEIAKEIMRSGEVTKSRANLIARTEVARTATELTKVRAEAVGVTHYVWRTSEDSDVRSSHKHMNGKVIAFNDPPEVEPGKRYHAGQIYNCRCYVEPILPEV